MADVSLRDIRSVTSACAQCLTDPRIPRSKAPWIKEQIEACTRVFRAMGVEEEWNKILYRMIDETKDLDPEYKPAFDPRENQSTED